MRALSAAQVLQIAMQLEERMEVSYQILASIVGRKSEATPRLFEECALEENEHFRTFEDMFREVCARVGRPELLTPSQEAAILGRFGRPIVPDLEMVKENCRTWTLGQRWTSPSRPSTWP